MKSLYENTILNFFTINTPFFKNVLMIIVFFTLRTFFVDAFLGKLKTKKSGDFKCVIKWIYYIG